MFILMWDIDVYIHTYKLRMQTLQSYKQKAQMCKKNEGTGSFWGSVISIRTVSLKKSLFLLRSFDPFLRSSDVNLWAFYILWLFLLFVSRCISFSYTSLRHKMFMLHVLKIIFLPKIMTFKSQQRNQLPSFSLSSYKREKFMHLVSVLKNLIFNPTRIDVTEILMCASNEFLRIKWCRI